MMVRWMKGCIYMLLLGFSCAQAASNIKIEYGSSAAATITLASLATDASLLTGRESDGIDNTTNKYLDYLVSGKVTTGTSPTASKEIRVYVVGLMEDSTYPDVFDGTDSGETVSSTGTRDAVCKLVAVMATANTSDKAYYFGPVSVAALFGGVMPKKFVIFITHNTGVNLNSTGGNQAIYTTPVYQTVSMLYLRLPSQRTSEIAQIDPRLRAGLLGRWSGGGSGLTQKDSSGYGNEGVLTGAPVWSLGRDAQRNALWLNGTADYVQVNAQVYSLSGGSVALWVQRQGAGTGIGCVTGSYGGAGEQRCPTISFEGGTNIMWEFGSLFSQDSGVPFTLGEWFHVALTYDASFNCLFYVNGVQVSSATATTPGALLSSVHIGHYGNFGSSFFNGIIDDFRIYDRPLSGAEVVALMNPIVSQRVYFAGVAPTSTSPKVDGITPGKVNGVDAPLKINGVSYIETLGRLDAATRGEIWERHWLRIEVAKAA